MSNELRDNLPENIQLQCKIVEDLQWGADEIERLIKEVKRLKDVAYHFGRCADLCPDDISEAIDGVRRDRPTDPNKQGE